MLEKLRLSISVSSRPSSESGLSTGRAGRVIVIPVRVSEIARFENVQLRITPSFSHPIRIAFVWLVREQLVTTIFSQTLFSLSEILFALTTMQSSPVVIIEFETVTFRLELTWIPSLFGNSASASILTLSKLTRSQSLTQYHHPAG